MKSEHGKKDIKTFHKKANPDSDKEFSGSKPVGEGEYINARNARPYSVDGETGALSKIKGEEIQYSNFNLSSNYACIGSISVSEHQVELWASATPGDLDSIRIDGQVMVQSDDLLFSLDFPFQLDKNERCAEGEIFLTDNNKIPMIFDIGDIISEFNAGTQKYFSLFNRKLYEINLSTPLDIPVVVELANVGGGAGLPTGEYSYSIRYVNAAGDRTNIGPNTPLIPILQSIGPNSPQYPYTKTRGGDANLLVKTSYGIKLRFRVTNLLNYDSIEIIRYAWNTGVLGFVPTPVIVGRIPVSSGQISIEEFIDPSNSNVDEVVTDADVTNQLSFIEKAKAIRYYDKKLVLMNYTLAERSMTADFLQRGGVEMFPVVQKLGKAGHNDPFNHAYNKGYMGGEEYGFGIQGYDGVAGKGFALGVPNFGSYQFPNRREEVSGDSLTYSYNGTSTAANIDGLVTNVFEAFDLVDAVKKQDICTFKNVASDGGKFTSDVDFDCPSGYANFGGNINGTGIVEGPYSPYRPVNQNDGDVSGHDYRVNTAVRPNTTSNSVYDPQGYAPNYYAKGIALNGVDNLPLWVKSFSVVRTERADRVVAQGVGVYKLNEADFNAVGNAKVASKERNKFWFYSSDMFEGIVNQSVIDDMQVNPGNYKIQLVSPLGFFSELYNFERDQGADRDRICDMITYVRGLHDAGELNPNESGVGVSDYVAYNKYRNSDSVNGDFFSGSDGNKTTDLKGLTVETDGRSSYFELEVVDNVYNTEFTGGTTNNDFNDSGMKDFTEPMYMINIIQDGKTIVDKNIDNYKQTSTYIKLESIIGEGDGSAIDPSFLLVDERWEDCIPALTSGSPLATQERFVYLDDSLGQVEPWYNVTYLTPAQIAIVVNDIALNGFYVTPLGVNVYGVYTHTISTNQREFTVNFDIPGFNIIPLNTKVLVRYDNDSPIQVYGGDVTVAETVFATVDRQATGEDNSTQRDKQFALDIGFPFRRYFVTPRHYIIGEGKLPLGGARIQDSKDLITGNRVYGRLAYIRQMVINFIAETRAATHFYYEGSGSNNGIFPATHYIIRPNEFDDDEFSNGAAAVYDDNNIYADYEDDYGDEYLNWEYGGFRFLGVDNNDYSQEQLIDSFSRPDVGFTDENEFCTGIIWSLSRAINQQDSPGLKSFISNNSYGLSDDQGEIKRAWDATSGKGDNLYAITNSGIALLLTNKAVLSGIDASEIGVSFVDKFVGADYWIDKKVGMTDEMWRTFAEASIVIKAGGTTLNPTEERNVEALFFANDRSVYRFHSNKLVNIGKTGYYSELVQPLKLTLPGYQSRMAGLYDEKHESYGLQLAWEEPVAGLPAIQKEDLFMFSQVNKGFTGAYDFKFDSYMMNDNTLYGMRSGETYELDKGYIINGTNIEFSVLQAAATDPFIQKEFMFINANSDVKPTRIEFYNEDMQFLCAMDQSIQGPSYLKKYDGFYQQIPRQDASISVNRDRVQLRVVIYKIIHNLGSEFKLKNCIIDYKNIK